MFGGLKAGEAHILRAPFEPVAEYAFNLAGGTQAKESLCVPISLQTADADLASWNCGVRAAFLTFKPLLYVSLDRISGAGKLWGPKHMTGRSWILKGLPSA